MAGRRHERSLACTTGPPACPWRSASWGLALAVYALGSRVFGERGGFYFRAHHLHLHRHLPLHPLLYSGHPPCPMDDPRRTPSAPRTGRHRRATTSGARCSAAGDSTAVMALNVLTKGLIGAVFPIGLVFCYLAHLAAAAPGQASASALELPRLPAPRRPVALPRRAP